MQNLKKIFFPFENSSRISNILISIFWSLFFILLWYLFKPQTFPSPFEVLQGFITVFSSESFFEDFLASIFLTTKAMLFSIIIASILSYLYPIPFFKPLIEFATKCRYLTLTGLIFIFSIFSKDLSELKLWLLMFGIIPFFTDSTIGNIKEGIQDQIELAYTIKYNKWETLFETIIIGKLDKSIEVIRQNFAIAWLMITMVEGLDMSGGGLGTELLKYSKYLNLVCVFSVQILIFCIGLLLDFCWIKLRMVIFPYVKINEK